MSTKHLFQTVIAVCGIAVGASSAIAQSTHTRPGGSTRWEYLFMNEAAISDVGEKNLFQGMDILGNLGWELVGVFESKYIFKRPVPQYPVADVPDRLKAAELDREMWKDRATWAEHLMRKGYITVNQAQIEKERLQAAEAVLERLKKVQTPTEPKKEIKP